VSYADYKVTLQEGVVGNWSIRKFTVSEDESRLQGILSLGKGGRFPAPGDYTGLYRNGTVIMSDTPDEIRDHLGVIHEATGNVLIAGLGLGVVLQAIARKSEVASVTVIEISPDVIALVKPQLEAREWFSKVTIIEADIFTWKPAKEVSFDVAWFDVWDSLCTDNLAEMATLHRRFAKRTKYQGSWGKEYLKHAWEREKRSGW
jgi:SAM-dependent methyltransferase